MAASKEPDTTAARELDLFISNDGDLYRQQFMPIVTNLTKKKRSGKYNHAGAVKLFGYLMEAGAKKYAAEFGSGGDWFRTFDVPTRKLAAEGFAREFEREYDLGNYDHLVPAKAVTRRSPPRTAAQLSSDITRATGVRVR